MNASNSGWTRFPNYILKHEELHPMAKLVYACLTSYAGPKREIRPSYERIAKDVNTSSATVKRMLMLLRSHGLIEWDTRKGGARNESNLYRLLPLPSDPSGHSDLMEGRPSGHTDPTIGSHRPDPSGHSDPGARHSYQDIKASSNPEHQNSTQDALSRYEALPPKHKEAFGRMLKATNIDGLARHLAKTGDLQARLDTFSKELAKQEYIEQGGSAWGYEQGHVDVFSWVPSDRVIADLQEVGIASKSPECEKVLAAFRGKHGEPPFKKHSPLIWETEFRQFAQDYMYELPSTNTGEN